MKLQNLIIVFLALALPVILVLSVYVELQVKTAQLRTSYNDYLIGAAHETIVAFQLNTTSDTYSTVTDTKVRDIEASLNVFSSSLATSFGATGASKSYMMSYVPALLFTLYDGYYIYTPTKTWDSDIFVHELKPYVYYSKQYTDGNKVLTINYSLDNYVAVYYYDGSSYISRAGYLEADNGTGSYYQDARNFTNWFNNIVRTFPSSVRDALFIDANNSPLPGDASDFNDEKVEVIKDSVTNNLVQAMYIYGKNTGNDFQMPELTALDWDTILNNTCFIAFMQGLPVGTTVYNDYVIAVSTENKETVNENDIYYIGDDGSYHRIWCPHLTGNIRGYNKLQFKNQDSAAYRSVPACYYCMVRASDASYSYLESHSDGMSTAELRKRLQAYSEALSREKQNLVKISDYINGSGQL